MTTVRLSTSGIVAFSSTATALLELLDSLELFVSGECISGSVFVSNGVGSGVDGSGCLVSGGMGSRGVA